jgi:hypothetical protein
VRELRDIALVSAIRVGRDSAAAKPHAAGAAGRAFGRSLTQIESDFSE